MPQDPNKVRAIIDKMVNDGASDEEIDEVVSSFQRGDADFSDVTSGHSTQKKSRARDIAAPLAQGATFGFADEVLGGIEGLNEKLHGRSFSEGYERGKGKVRSVGRDYTAEHPLASAGAEIAGAIAPSVAAAPAALARGAAAGLGRRMAAGAAEGAVAGGVYGAGTGEGSGRVSSAAVGAGAGAALGGIAGPLITGAARTAKNLAAPLLSHLPGVGEKIAENQSTNLIARAIQRDAMHPVELSGRAIPGKPQILPDVGGENLLGLARGSQAIPSKSKQALSKNLLERQQGEMARAGSDLERAIGVPQDDVFQIADDLILRQKANAQPLYDAAHPKPIRNQATRAAVGDLLQIPVFRKAMGRGKELQQVLRIPQGKELTVRDIDYWKQGLDNLIESSHGSENAIARQEARAYRERLDEILKMVDKEHPEYAKARATFAGDARLREALADGREFIKSDPREIAAAVKKMTPGERELYNRGAIDTLNQAMAHVDDAETASAVKRIFGNPYKREQLKSLVGDRAYETLAERLGVERTMNRTAKTILSGSPTARIGAEIDDIAGINAGEIAASANDFARGNFAGPFIRRGLNAIGRGVSGNVGNVADKISGKMLLRPGTKEFDELMSLVEAIQRRNRNQSIGGGVTRRVTTGFTGGKLNP